ncbi:hypothetical protein OZX67_08475 [Bifidobacterium sp. ESL0728]|uniref:hypothetical protein n=1 Tax=Bifidobacterium sp. ESL0728 TaxID=2983220 RepID=UPI0023F72739|nr:hypothetical protein [Bifidobacterium sp. ESL0728]WEV58812.1 hypothetical protein OZX67_08475 [Bifidobacterium sp. ESL0728]
MRAETLFNDTFSVELPDEFTAKIVGTQDNENDSSNDESIVPAHPFFSVPEDEDTSIEFVPGEEIWDDDTLTERLGGYAETIDRTHAGVDNLEFAIREGRPQTQNHPLGLITYTYKTLDANYSAIFVLAPLNGKDLCIFMDCTYDNAFVRSDQFMDIAESITINKETDTDTTNRNENRI